MVKYNDKKLGAILQREITNADTGTEREANKEEALKYYFGKLPGPDKGLSTAVSMDVADMTNAVMATILPMISTDAVVTYEPNDEADEAGARMESDAVNLIILEDNQGVIKFQEGVKNALLLRNGWLRVYFDDDETVDRMTLETDFNDMSSEEIAVVLSPQQPNETREMEGDNTIKRVVTDRTFRIESIASENMLYQSGASTMDLDKLRFVSEKQMISRSDLIVMGVSKTVVDKLPTDQVETNQAANTRSRGDDMNMSAETKDQEQVECYMCYLLIDMDGDGISERWEILLANNNQVLLKNEVYCVPYATGSPYIVPQSLQGESLFDHLKSVQDSKSHAIRQWSNNLHGGNNNRLAYVPSMVNPDDLLESNPNSTVRVQDIGAIMPIPFNDVGPSSQNFLAYQDKIRSERGGAALDMLSADAQIVGDTAFGIDRQYSSREQMVDMFATNLSETMIRRTYWLMHKFLRLYSNEPLKVKLNGVWQETDPRQWPERSRLNVATGKTAGARGNVQRALREMMQLQIQAISAGMPLADLETVYRTASDWLRMAGLDSPEAYLIDPSSPEAKKMMEDQAAKQQEQQQAQEQQREQMLEIQMSLEHMKMELEQWKHESELEYKYYNTNIEADTKEMETVSSNVVEIEKAALTNERKTETGDS